MWTLGLHKLLTARLSRSLEESIGGLFCGLGSNDNIHAVWTIQNNVTVFGIHLCGLVVNFAVHDTGNDPAPQ